MAWLLSEMTVLAIDEILLRTEISGSGEEGTRRRASERVRRGYGRDKRGPPAYSRVTSLRNGPGAGTAATSAALPHTAVRTPRAESGAGTARTAPSTPFRSEILQSSYSTSEDEISMRKNIHTAHKRHNSRINDKTTTSATYKNRSHTSTTQPGCGTSPRNDGEMARARRARRGFTAAYSTPSESMKGKRTAWTRSAFMRWPPSKVCDMPG